MNPKLESISGACNEIDKVAPVQCPEEQLRAEAIYNFTGNRQQANLGTLLHNQHGGYVAAMLQ